MPKHAWYSLYSAQVRHIQSSVSSFGILSRRKMWAYWSHSSEGSLKWFRDWGIWHSRRGWGSWNHHSLNLEKRRLRWDLINVHKYLLGRNKEDQAMLSLVVSIRRMRGNGHKLNTKEISFKPKTILFFFYCEGGQTPRQVVQRVCGASIRGDTWTLTGKNLWAACSSWPSLSRGAGWDDLQRSLPTSAVLWFLGGDLACWRFTTTEFGIGKEFLLMKLGETVISSASLWKVFSTELTRV